jgi:hypothetical protein
MKFSELLGCPSHINQREKHDFYQTPPECTEALIAAEDIRMPPQVWDPCCGAGDISRVLEASGRDVVSTDLIDRGFGRGGIDFLTLSMPLAPAIVTNPPFECAEAILRHAARIGVEYLVFLHKAHWLNAAKRARLIEEVWCPARCWLLTWRPDFKGQGAPTMDCSWYVFERASMHGCSWQSRCLPKPQAVAQGWKPSPPVDPKKRTSAKASRATALPKYPNTQMIHHPVTLVIHQWSWVIVTLVIHHPAYHQSNVL